MKYVFTLILLMLVIFPQEIRKTYYPSGELETVGEYVNGQRDGYYKEYYKSGQLWKEWFFKDGKRE